MTVEEKIARLTDLVGDIGEGLGRLTGVVETLAGTVVAHDRQIEALLQASEIENQRIQALSREWQAYLRTIRPQ